MELQKRQLIFKFINLYNIIQTGDIMFENKKIFVFGLARSGYEVSKLLSKYNNDITVLIKQIQIKIELKNYLIQELNLLKLIIQKIIQMILMIML